MRFYPLEKLINLYDGYIREFKIDELHLLLVQRGVELYLLEAHCPHRGYPLDAAIIERDVIRCVRHGYEFALVDGCLVHATGTPCRGLRIFPVIYEDNEVGIMIDQR